jgi:hypothetical protein
MSSIYERVLIDFHRLHPQIQRRFGFEPDGLASSGLV